MNLPTPDEIIDDLSFFDDWEQKYSFIIDLGKGLPTLPEDRRTPESLVKGCQSNVWLHSRQESDRLCFDVDSDAIIVRGLLALVMSAYNDKPPASIREFDIDGYFKALDLERHLSPTRGNGLRAIVARIRAQAGA